MMNEHSWDEASGDDTVSRVASQNADPEREPIAPDANGLCYRDEQHFDETMTRVARDQLARRASLLENRIVPYAL